jgi:two-component system response regulator RegX3
MKARVLIVEDVREMAELIAMYLANEGLETVSCQTAEEALELCRRSPPDIVVLDINLPGMDGFEFLQTLRRESPVPVLIVSARDSDEDMILGLGVGADEFVTKPFSPKVLAARVRALLRRTRDLSAPRTDIVRFGDYALDREGYTLKRGEHRVSLSSREFEVLSYLVEHAGKPRSPEEVYADVWRNQYGDLTAVGVYVQRLRRKLEADPANPVYIQTVHGRGYRFNKEMLLQSARGTESKP